jgi:hypothetical protein
MPRRITLLRSRRDDARPARSRMARPSLETMEDRLLLYATEGGHFVYPSITYSFMPDGTSIGGVPSNLFQTLDAVTSTANWQAQFEKAAAVWQRVADVNLALVPDDGAPFGSGSYQQGDPGMGDIRIGAMAQAGGVLATTMLPPPLNGGSLSGDIIFNSSQPWHVGSNFDIETVAIHEIGHALGMGHSGIASADMYAYYQNVRQTLDPDDVAGIQSIWDAVPSTDASGNATLATASDMWYLYAAKDDPQAVIGGQSISNGTDRHYYRVFVPWNTTGQMTVTMQSVNAGSLTPAVDLLDANGNVLSQASAPSNGTTASLTWSVSPGQVYYIRTAAAAGGIGSSGTYGLGVNFGSSYQAVPASMASAFDTWNWFNFDNDQVAITGMSITDNIDYQYYRVFVPWNTSGQMTVTMQSSGLSSLSPRVVLLDANGFALTQAAAPNSYGTTVSLTWSVSPGQVYYIRTSSANGGPGSNGAYALELNLGSSYQPPVPPRNTAVAAQPDQGGGSASEVTGGLAAGRPGRARSGSDSGSDTVTLGSLVVAGDAMTVSPALQARHAGLDALHRQWGGSGNRPVDRKPIWIMETPTTAHHLVASGLGRRRHLGPAAGPD